MGREFYEDESLEITDVEISTILRAEKNRSLLCVFLLTRISTPVLAQTNPFNLMGVYEERHWIVENEDYSQKSRTRDT